METQEPCTKQGYCLHVQIHNCPWRSRLPSACNQPFPALPLPSLALAFLILSISEALEELSRVRPAPGFLFPGAPMSSPASPQGKGGRLWKALLLPLLLPLLIAGSWALPEAQHLHRVAGQTLSVTCQYPPKVWPYERKGWCKELSAFKCTRLVTSSGPGRLVQSSRFSIWDNPSTGLFIVTMTGLKEEDSGHYWCRIYHASGNSVSKSIRFYLAVSPAPASTQASRASAELVSSPTQSSVPPAGRAKQAPRPASAITTLSPQQNSTLRSHPAAPSALVPVLCVLLVAKGLALTVLTVRALRSPHVQHRGKSLMHPAPPRPQASGSKDGQSSPGPQGAPPWTLNLLFTAKKRQKSPRTCSKTLGYTPRSSAEDFPASPRPKIQAHQLLTRNWLLGQHHPGGTCSGQP
ncbi:natural cytotoxicity triggering receptor 2-like isoform X3 [Mustela erminea]|uniref:natural cytotoxicity triggering receptor 2-like isoform X3 n=1 Tax=Mustela erminea TaxID=36723 RepID=UPI001387230E|nr:natural cytotoxicity triggering receptor 2-like isoform X3 [Mustela erminea]